MTRPHPPPAANGNRTLDLYDYGQARSIDDDAGEQTSQRNSKGLITAPHCISIHHVAFDPCKSDRKLETAAIAQACLSNSLSRLASRTLWFAKNICAGEHQKHLGSGVWAVSLVLFSKGTSPGQLCTCWRRGLCDPCEFLRRWRSQGRKRRCCHC